MMNFNIEVFPDTKINFFNSHHHKFYYYFSAPIPSKRLIGCNVYFPGTVSWLTAKESPPHCRCLAYQNLSSFGLDSAFRRLPCRRMPCIAGAASRISNRRCSPFAPCDCDFDLACASNSWFSVTSLCCISTAVFSAFSASSGVVFGAPNIAIISSPMYLSSVPPLAKIISAIAVK